MKKNIVVACATGVATSTVICNRIEDLCKKAGIDYYLIQCKVSEIGGYEEQADLIVTSGKSPRVFKAPTVKATAFITGINPEEVDERILDVLKNRMQ